jgi:hypothetical protein
MSAQLTADALLADPRFWAIERVHMGHNGECNTDGRRCGGIRIGATVTLGAVTWFDGDTFADALGKVERSFNAGPHEYAPSWRPREESYHYVSCVVCGVAGHAHGARQ